jgi:Phage tail assembly chaperone protein
MRVPFLTLPNGHTIHNATRADVLEAGGSAALFDGAIAEGHWRAFRARRDGLLAVCDWTQMSDAPLTSAQQTAWRDYRAALRDLPATLAAAGTDPAVALNNPAHWPSAPQS